MAKINWDKCKKYISYEPISPTEKTRDNGWDKYIDKKYLNKKSNGDEIIDKIDKAVMEDRKRRAEKYEGIPADQLYDNAHFWKTYSTNYKFTPKVIVKKKLTKDNDSVK